MKFLTGNVTSILEKWEEPYTQEREHKLAVKKSNSIYIHGIMAIQLIGMGKG